MSGISEILTKQTDRSNDAGGINAEVLEDRVHNGVQGSSESTTAKQRANTLRSLRLVLILAAG
jgi:hypothetical protein